MMPKIKHVFEACRGGGLRRGLVGASSYGLDVQRFDHMFDIRTHYRLLFEQVSEH
jgi:hypothetical protein